MIEGATPITLEYHVVVTKPSMFDVNPLWQMQIESFYVAEDDEGKPKLLPFGEPPLSAFIDAKMQLVPDEILMGLFVQATTLAQHILHARQIGKIAAGDKQFLSNGRRS